MSQAVSMRRRKPFLPQELRVVSDSLRILVSSYRGVFLGQHPVAVATGKVHVQRTGAIHGPGVSNHLKSLSIHQSVKIVG
jgi:hypothetical protein